MKTWAPLALAIASTFAFTSAVECDLEELLDKLLPLIIH